MEIVIGARYAGMRPDLGPLGHPVENPGLNALQVLEKLAKTDGIFLYVVGSRSGDKFSQSYGNQARSKTGFFSRAGPVFNRNGRQADIVLAHVCFAEKAGSFIKLKDMCKS